MRHKLIYDINIPDQLTKFDYLVKSFMFFKIPAILRNRTKVSKSDINDE